MQIIYKIADSGDVEKVLTLQVDYLQSVSKTNLSEAQAAELRYRLYQYMENNVVFSILAIDRNKLIGIVTGVIYELPPQINNYHRKTCKAGNLFSYKQYKGRGIGKQLMIAFESYCKSAGIKH